MDVQSSTDSCLASPAPILIGNSFPWALVERAVTARPSTHSELRARLDSTVPSGVHSFWGHPNTLDAASAFAGTDLTPDSQRPSLSLDGERLPTLGGISFREIWLISPRYRPNFRPPESGSVAPEDIERWQVIHLSWV
jgi:hypothetical protein